LASPAYVSRDRRREILDLFATDPSAGQVAEFFGPQPDPYLQNSDGHDYVDAEVTLGVPDLAETWRCLASAFVVIDEAIVEHHVVIDSRTVSLGRVTREGRRLVVWANSLERLAVLEERVRAMAPQAREVGRRARRLGGEPSGRTGKPVRSLIVDAYLVPVEPGVAEEQVLEEMLRERSRSWVDEPNDLGMTPREAARAGGAARVELEAMPPHGPRPSKTSRSPGAASRPIKGGIIRATATSSSTVPVAEGCLHR
jgi:hypothetical protein